MSNQIPCWSCGVCGDHPNDPESNCYLCSNCVPLEPRIRFKQRLERAWRGDQYDGTRVHFSHRFQLPRRVHFGATWESIPGLQTKIMPFLNGDSSALAFLGPPGTGKTWAAWATVFAFLIKRFNDNLAHNVVHWAELLLLATESEAFGARGEAAQEKLDRYSRGLLVVDEFGVTKSRESQQNQVMKLLNDRHEDGFPTIATSTKSVAELIEAVGEGSVSRCVTGGVVVNLNGKDRRIR